MERIWAPWRMDFIEEGGTSDCIFCTKPAANNDEQNLILERGLSCFTMMNLYPYNNGHIMVSPFRHTDDITLLTEDEFLEMHKAINRGVKSITSVMSPNGFNIGINIGKVAGAGFEKHIHVHIVPRWNGDTNFMPVLSDTKIMPEHIRKTYAKLTTAIRAIKE